MNTLLGEQVLHVNRRSVPDLSAALFPATSSATLTTWPAGADPAATLSDAEPCNGIVRWYDPITGRWLSNDPIGISGGLNQYVFCANNPVNLRDPYGNMSLNAVVALEGALAVFYSVAGLAMYNTMAAGIEPGQQIYTPIVNAFGQNATVGDYYVFAWAYKFKDDECKEHTLFDVMLLPRSWGRGPKLPGQRQPEHPYRKAVEDMMNPPIA